MDRKLTLELDTLSVKSFETTTLVDSNQPEALAITSQLNCGASNCCPNLTKYC